MKESCSDKVGLIIFDCDGVLNSNSREAYQHCYRETLLHLDVDLCHADMVSVLDTNWGAPQNTIINELLMAKYEKKSKIPGGIESEAPMLYRHILGTEFSEIIRPIPGCAEALGELSLKYTLAMSTSADKRVLFEQVLPRLQIDPELFGRENIIAASDVAPGLSKPDPYPLNYLMELNGAQPDNTISIGDDVADVLSAIGADVTPIVTRTGNITAQQEPMLRKEFGVTHFIDSVTDLVDLAPRLINPRKVGRVCLSSYA